MHVTNLSVNLLSDGVLRRFEGCHVREVDMLIATKLRNAPKMKLSQIYALAVRCLISYIWYRCCTI